MAFLALAPIAAEGILAAADAGIAAGIGTGGIVGEVAADIGTIGSAVSGAASGIGSTVGSAIGEAASGVEAVAGDIATGIDDFFTGTSSGQLLQKGAVIGGTGAVGGSIILGSTYPIAEHIVDKVKNVDVDPFGKQGDKHSIDSDIQKAFEPPGSDPMNPLGLTAKKPTGVADLPGGTTSHAHAEEHPNPTSMG